jgi:hypothetical protein
MSNPRSRRFAAVLPAALCAAMLAACGPADAPSPSPAPSVRPTPTPIAAPVTTPADAAARVIATDALFKDAIELTPDIIGASKWWTATPGARGGYTIVLTVGWGDCPAGCSSRHVWTFDVKADGTLALVSETGEPVPSVLPG